VSGVKPRSGKARTASERINLDKDDLLPGVRDSISNLDADLVRQRCLKAVESGVEPFDIIHAMNQGMQAVGDKYERGDFFLSELIAAGAAMKEGMSVVQPHLTRHDSKAVGKIVIGTVKGDLHDIGKDIAISLLKAAGFETIDLGIDVPAEQFAKTVSENNSGILGMSGLLTPSLLEMQNVIQQLQQRGLRGKLKVVIGGYPITNELARKVGADAGVNNASTGVKICRQWIQQSR